MWHAFLATLAFSTCTAIPVYASCETEATAKPDSDCVVLSFQNKRGVWFELNKADELRKASLEVGELRLQIKDHELRAVTRDYQVQTYRDVIKLKSASLDEAKKSMVAFVRQTREARKEASDAREELHAWYRSPVLYMGIGAAVVTTIVVALSVSSIGK
jgi:hypothetical protein